MLTDDCGDGTHICPGSMSAPGHPPKEETHKASHVYLFVPCSDASVLRISWSFATRNKCPNANDADNISIAKLTK